MVPATDKRMDEDLLEYDSDLENALERREHLANQYDVDYGQERVFPALVEALLAEVPEDARVLEVGAATGLLTRPLLTRAGHVTALEPSAGFLRRLLSSEVAHSPHLTVVQGMVEGLLHDLVYDVAVVTFTPRHGLGLSRLLVELALRVRERVILLLDEDGAMDWAYLARQAAAQGFDVSLRIVANEEEDPDRQKRVVLLVADIGRWVPGLSSPEDWVADAREVEVPFPAPRGTATQLVRYMLARGDRVLRVRTRPEGLERLYGNLRTAVHRLGRDRLIVRRDDDTIQIVRLPRTGEAE